MPRILISYRRADAAYVVTALYDKLAERYGDKNVFMDTDTIPAGSDFREHLEGAVQRCDVVLAIIGTRWRDVVDSEGRRRLDSPHDWVRIELETALSRKIPVIPLLVDDASMPQAEHLPESLRALTYRQALPLRPGRDFQHDVDVLGRAIERPRDVPARPRTAPARPARWRRRLMVGSAVLAGSRH